MAAVDGSDEGSPLDGPPGADDGGPVVAQAVSSAIARKRPEDRDGNIRLIDRGYGGRSQAMNGEGRPPLRGGLPPPPSPRLKWPRGEPKGALIILD